MSGLISCFPGPGDVAAGGKDAAAALTQTGGGASGGGLGSGDSAPPAGSMAAFAALLRQAGVRAPTTVGDSTMMVRDGSMALDSSSHGGSQHTRTLNAIGARPRACSCRYKLPAGGGCVA